MGSKWGNGVRQRNGASPQEMGSGKEMVHTLNFLPRFFDSALVFYYDFCATQG